MTDYENYVEILKHSGNKFVEIKNCEYDGVLYDYIGIEDKDDIGMITGAEFNIDGTLHNIYFADGCGSLGDFEYNLQQCQVNPNESEIDKAVRQIKNARTDKEIKEIIQSITEITVESSNEIADAFKQVSQNVVSNQ